MADDAVRELSGKLGLDTTDFKTALTAANRELRVLESGFRASAAGLGDWAKNASGLELRIESLTGQIGIQQAKVAALRSEYERVAAEKGANSRAAQDLQIKLNRETETLGKMQIELRATQTNLDGMGDESSQAAKETTTLAKAEDKAEKSTKTLGERMKDLSDRLKDAGGNIRGFAAGVAKAAAGIAVGLAAAVGAAAAGIGALVLNLASAADEIVENAEMMGITAEQYQTFKFIGDQVGTSVETVARAFGRTTKAMTEAQKRGSPMAKLFKDLGVNVKDANGNLRDSEEVFQDLIGALGNIENETQREIIAQQLFGKSYQELIPLINAGADGIADMTQQAREMGAIMSEDTVNAAADLNDKLGALKAGVGGLVARLAGAFIPLISKVADKFQEWLSSPAVQQGIETLSRALGILADALGDLLSGNLDDAFTKFGAFGAILARLFGASDKDANSFGAKIIRTFKGIASGIGGAFAGIGSAIAPIVAFFRDQLIPAVGKFITEQLIPFVQQHGPEIKGALIAVGIALAAIGVVIPVIAAVLAALTSPITLIIAAVALLGAAWAGNWGGIQEKTAAVWAWLQPILQKIGAWLGENIPKAVAAVSEWFNGTLLPALKQVGDFIRDKAIPNLTDMWNWLATNIPKAIEGLMVWFDSLVVTLTTVYNFFANNLIPKLTDLGTLIGETLGGIISTFIDLLTGKISLLDAIEQIWGLLSENLNPILEKLGDIFETVLPGPIKDFIKDTLDKLQNGFEGIRDIVDGIITKVTEFILALIEAAKNVPALFRAESPTPFEQGLRGIGKAARELANNDIRRLGEALKDLNKTGLTLGGLGTGSLAGAGAGGQGAAPVTINVTAYTPLDIEKIALRVTEIQARRSR
jgi:hypothetical protein